MHSSCLQGRQAIEWVIGKIETEMTDLKNSAVKNKDEIITQTRKSIDEFRSSTRKTLDEMLLTWYMEKLLDQLGTSSSCDSCKYNFHMRSFSFLILMISLVRFIISYFYDWISYFLLSHYNSYFCFNYIICFLIRFVFHLRVFVGLACF